MLNLTVREKRVSSICRTLGFSDIWSFLESRDKFEQFAAASKNKTFKECAISYMESHSEDYANEKHRKQWSATLNTYAYPVIGELLVSDITMRHVLDVLLQKPQAKINN